MPPLATSVIYLGIQQMSTASWHDFSIIIMCRFIPPCKFRNLSHCQLSVSQQPAPPQCFFDSGALHHVTGDVNNLKNFSDYGGLNDINISVVHACLYPTLAILVLLMTIIHLLWIMFPVHPLLKRIPYPVWKFCQSNDIPLEFFPLHLLWRSIWRRKCFAGRTLYGGANASRGKH